MNETAGTPLPMNSTGSHPKVKLSLAFSDKTFAAGDHVCGALEMSSHGGTAGKELGIGRMMVEMWGVQELLSRDHTAKAPFLYCRRLFQGPGLPPSNAVHAHPLPNTTPLPAHYFLAKKGQSSFNFRIPLPHTAPSSIMFASAARVRYEVRASVQVFWRGETKVLVFAKEVDVVENPDTDFARDEPEAVAVGENGKIWMQAKLVGGVLVAGESACIELQVKNHSPRKNSSLTVALTRTLHIANAPDALLISDTLANHPFRGPDFIIPPGAEGVASLVFDVPRLARSVRGGLLDGLDGQKPTHALFDIRAVVTVKMGMGLGRNDIVVEIPVTIVHPSVLPELPPPEEDYGLPPQDYYDHRAHTPYDPRVASPYGVASPYQQQPYYPVMSPPMSPPLAYVDPNQHLVWLPPPTPQPQFPGQPYYYPPQHAQPYAPRSVSPQYAPPPPPQPMPPSGLPAQYSPSAIVAQAQVPAPPPPALKIDMNNLAPVNLSPPGTSPQSQGVVHSPRPFLSPKLTATTADPFSHGGSGSVGRSERVEELERMADEQTDAKSAETKPMDQDKTLPGPPVPSGKVSATTQSRPRADVYFAGHKAEDAKPAPISEEAPAQISTPVQNLNSPPKSVDPPAPASIPIPVSPGSIPIPMSPAGGKVDDDELQTPPTPTLTAKSFKRGGGGKKSGVNMNMNMALSPNMDTNMNTESGLDALERRLLAEVGTRKEPPKSKSSASRAMAMDVTSPGKSTASPSSKPIDIPSPSTDSKEEGDSAISSLSLGAEDEWERERDWDERTHRGGGKANSAPKSEGKSRSEAKDSKEGKSTSKSKTRSKRSSDVSRKMQSSKGRVAEWLGGVAAEPEVEGVDEGLPVMSEDGEGEGGVVGVPSPKSPGVAKEEEEVPKVEDKPKQSSPTEEKAAPKPEAKEAEVEQADAEEEEIPHPRSSGFMPIGTFKRDAYSRTLIPKDANPWADETIRLRSVAGPGPEQTNPWRNVRKAAGGLPSFPPPRGVGDDEVKYDVRSARGGRGGKVTSVAAIFAATSSPLAKGSTASKPTSSSKPSSPSSGSKPATPKAAAGKRMPHSLGVGMGSKASVASSVAVSSSHARPTLSSTASLARPPVTGKKGWKPAVSVAEEESSQVDAEGGRKDLEGGRKDSEGGKNTSGPGKKETGYAFGQAKLKDLINKYQHSSGA